MPLYLTLSLSPSVGRYLLAKGRDEEAVKVVHYISRFNRAAVPAITVEDFRALDAADKLLSSVGSNGDAALLAPAQQSVGQRVKVSLPLILVAFGTVDHSSPMN